MVLQKRHNSKLFKHMTQYKISLVLHKITIYANLNVENDKISYIHYHFMCAYTTMTTNTIIFIYWIDIFSFIKLNLTTKIFFKLHHTWKWLEKSLQCTMCLPRTTVHSYSYKHSVEISCAGELSMNVKFYGNGASHSIGYCIYCCTNRPPL